MVLLVGTHLWEIGPAVASLISLTSCVWLVAFALPRVRKQDQQRLILRQLWHYAIGGGLASLATLCEQMNLFFVLPHLEHLEGIEYCDFLRYVLDPVRGLGTFVGLLAEVGIAMAIAAAASRRLHLHACLDRVLVMSWIGAIVLTIFRAFLNATSPRVSDLDTILAVKFPICPLQPVHAIIDVPDPVLALSLIVCSFMCVVSYFVLVWSARWAHAPQSVEHQLWHQGERYFLLPFAVWVPCLVFDAVSGTDSSTGNVTGPWQCILGSLACFSGALPAYAYSCQCRYLKKMRKDAERTEDQIGPGSGLSLGARSIQDEVNVGFQSERDVRTIPLVSNSENASIDTEDNGENRDIEADKHNQPYVDKPGTAISLHTTASVTPCAQQELFENHPMNWSWVD